MLSSEKTKLFVVVALSVLWSVGAVLGENVIQTENARPGTTDWILTKVKRHDDEWYDLGWNRRKQIEGYCSHTSIRAGETLKVFVNTDPAARYTADIYRMGYYGGKGARLMRSIGPFQGVTQPEPKDGERNLIECKWSEGFSIKIPQDWVSGVYLGKLTAFRDTGHVPDAGRTFECYVIFIVRDDRKADLMFQCSDMTWLAYNRWPKWRSMYDTAKDRWSSTAETGYYVSFDKPYGIFWNGFPAGFVPLSNGSGEFLMTEHPLAFWLEKEGYDVTYISNVDTHADAKGLLRGKVYISVGHDEYWTTDMLKNVIKARDAGVSLAFLSGNAVSGEVVLMPSTDGRPNRIQREVGDLPGEEMLMGATTYGVGFADWTCGDPNHWVFEGTNMRMGDRVEDLVGWEYQGPPLADYDTLEIISSGPVHAWDGKRRNRTYATTIYTWKKGNLVFNAGTCWWSMVLSSPPGFMSPPRRYFKEDDERVQRITKNVLDKMISIEAVDR